MKSYLISWLASRYRAARLDAFERELPGPWVVWEAGPWRPRPSERETVLAGARPAFAAGEALAIALVRRNAAPGPVTLGRAPENDIVIDDATLSRHHLAFEPAGEGRWRVRDLGSSNGTRVDGAHVGAAPVPLVPGALVEPGAVRLSFLDSATLHFRLRGAS